MGSRLVTLLSVVAAAQAGPWALLPESFQDTRKALQRDYPAVQFQFAWGRVYLVYGGPIGGGATPLESAERFLITYGGLFGVPREELVRTSVIQPAPGQGPAYVYYDQVFAGVPLESAGISFTIANDEGHAITLVSSRLHPSPVAYLRERRVTKEQAREIVRRLFIEPPEFRGEVEPVIWPVAELPEYGWRADVQPPRRELEAERVFVSAFDGRVLARRPLVARFGPEPYCWVTVNGDLTMTADGHIPLECTGALRVPLAYVPVELSWESYLMRKNTDASGQVFFGQEELPTDMYWVTARLDDDFFIVRDGVPPGQPHPPAYSESAGPFDPNDPVQVTLSFVDKPGREKTEQHVDAWYWLHAGREWILGLDPDFSVGPKLIADCNRIGPCSPAYTPQSGIALYNAHDPNDPNQYTYRLQCRCQWEPEYLYYKDSHFSTVILHEYGHHVHTYAHPAAGLAGVWPENFADTLAAFVTGTSKINEKWCACQSLGAYRDIDEPDILWPQFVYDHYVAGRCMSGAYWDMRKELDRSGKILLHSVKKLPIGVDPTIALHAVLVDDDANVFPLPHGASNNNLADGSPNYEKINAAFRLHDLATKNVAYVTTEWDGAPPGDPTVTGDFVVRVRVEPGNLELAAVDPVKLRYRLNQGTGAGGTWAEKVMTFQGGNVWSATLRQGYEITKALGDLLDYYVRVEVTDPAKRYTCFPTQAQFDFTPGERVPEERDFFSAVVTNREKTVALETDLYREPDPPWLRDPNDPNKPDERWLFGAPEFRHDAEQPAFDYPYDSDGGTLADGPYCYYTGRNGGVRGDILTWTLTTVPEFNLSGASKAVVSYALWFYVRLGNPDVDKFEVQLGSGETWRTIDEIKAVGPPPPHTATALQRWIRRRVKVSDLNPQVDRALRFKAIRAPSSLDAMVEACVDEVRVWRVYQE